MDLGLLCGVAPGVARRAPPGTFKNLWIAAGLTQSFEAVGALAAEGLWMVGMMLSSALWSAAP
jgi:hypothetical protein